MVLSVVSHVIVLGGRVPDMTLPRSNDVHTVQLWHTLILLLHAQPLYNFGSSLFVGGIKPIFPTHIVLHVTHRPSEAINTEDYPTTKIKRKLIPTCDNAT